MYRFKTGSRKLERLCEGASPGRYERIRLKPLGMTIGAEITGVDLRNMDVGLYDEIDAALQEWKALAIRGQDLTREQFHAFAAHWGRIVEDSLPRQVANKGEIEPIANPVDNVVSFTRDHDVKGMENCWHVDGSYRQRPALATMLYAEDVPALGGDTMFADMAAAYDNLDDATKAQIDDLEARHFWAAGGYSDKFRGVFDEYGRIVPPVRQPMVMRHPRTGRKTLFVNGAFALDVPGMDAEEGDKLLDMLARQANVPEYQCRMRWEPGLVVLWDNFAVQHYAVNDYWPQKRTLMRATVDGPWATGVVAP